jgi:hypothetical protein
MKTNRGARDMSIGNLNMDNHHLGLKYPKLGLQNVKGRSTYEVGICLVCFKCFLHSKIWNKFIRPPKKLLNQLEYEVF